MTEKEIKNEARSHRLTCYISICVIRIAMMLLNRNSILPEGWLTEIAAAYAAFFALFEAVTISLLWKWIATKHLDFLATFHTATSGFRMLLILIVLGIIAAIEGRDNMLPWVIAFMAYYFVMLILHSVFFTKMANKLFKQ